MKKHLSLVTLAASLLLAGCKPQPTQPQVSQSTSTATVTSTAVSASSRPKILQSSKNTLLLEKNSMRIERGSSAQIVIAQCPAGYEDDLIFVSSHPNFVKVDGAGVVTGIASGAATVNVSIHGAAVYQTIIVYVS